MPHEPICVRIIYMGNVWGMYDMTQNICCCTHSGWGIIWDLIYFLFAFSAFPKLPTVNIHYLGNNEHIKKNVFHCLKYYI